MLLDEEQEQRRPIVDAALSVDAAAPLDDAQLLAEPPQLPVLLADVLHAPLSASNARSAVADDEAIRRMKTSFFKEAVAVAGRERKK